MAELVAVATGTLERSPLTHLLVYCLDRGLTGTLVLQTSDDQRHAILFSRGVPIKVRTAPQVAPLGKLLVEQSLVVAAAVADALATARTGSTMLGQALIAAGHLSHEKLSEMLRLQTHRKLLSLFELPPDTAFGFYEKNLLESWGSPEPAPVDVIAVIHAGSSQNPDHARIQQALATLGERPIKLRPEGDLRRFRFDPRERAVLDLIRVKPMPAAQLLGSGAAPEATIERVLYSLLLTRHIDLGPGTKPVLGYQPPASPSAESSRAAAGRLKLQNLQKGGSLTPAPPPSTPAPSPGRNVTSSAIAALIGLPLEPLPEQLSPELDARRREINERFERIEREDFFSMLGVSQDAPPAVVQAAYFSLAKRWHPDRLPPQLSAQRDQVSRIFTLLSEASQTLADPEKKARYLELMKQGGGSPEDQQRVNKLLEAQVEFQKAEILLKKGDLTGADRFASQAAEKDPDQPDYAALLAWVRAGLPAASPDDVAASVRRLDRVLSFHDSHRKALWYRGLLLKRLGRDSLAVVDFRKLIELEPRNVDAAREVRLFELRGGDRVVEEKKEPEKKGLFGGIFNKK